MGPLALSSAAAVPQPVPDLSTPVGVVPAAGGAGLKHIPPDLEKHISKVTSQFEKQVVKFIRNKDCLLLALTNSKCLMNQVHIVIHQAFVLSSLLRKELTWMHV